MNYTAVKILCSGQGKTKIRYLSLSLLRTAGANHKQVWNGLLALVTLMLYSIAVAALVLMALFYTRSEGCMYNKVLIGVNGGLCLFVSLVAISPCVQNRESTDPSPPGFLVLPQLCAWRHKPCLGRKSNDSSEFVLLLTLYLHCELLWLTVSLTAKTTEVGDILGVPSGTQCREGSPADGWHCVVKFI